MAQTMTGTTNKPAWVDLASSDAEASRDFYSKLFGWQVEVNPDPQYGGYGLAKLGGSDAAGIGPKQDPNAPTAWSLYIGSDDIEGLARRVDGQWRIGGRGPVRRRRPGTHGGVHRPSRGLHLGLAGHPHGRLPDRCPQFVRLGRAQCPRRRQRIAVLHALFGWTVKTSPMGEGQPDYNEFQIGDKSVAGAWEMNPSVPAEVPSYWQVYFAVDDVDAAFRKALELGAREINAPMEYPGGKFAIVADPQGASFGLLKTSER